MPPAAYLNNRFDPNEQVLWGTAGVSVRSVAGQQAVSFTFNGPFTAFHYDPFVAEAAWDLSNVYNNGAQSSFRSTIVVLSLLVAIMLGLLAI